MTTNLVIVESAAKAKTIQGYLNGAAELAGMGRWVVMASAGHIKDLPTKTLGVDTATWAVTYVAAAGKARTVAALKRAAANADVVWLASDPDREGAAIAWHLARELKLGPGARRIAFHEITPAALVHAVRHPTGLDMDLVAAQETRRILDRVVGYQLSPVLWQRFPRNRGLSAGRVQSVALRLLVDRAAEATLHEPREYWTVTGVFQLENEKADVTATAYCNKKIASFWEASSARDGLRSMAAVPAWTAHRSHTVVSKSPLAPFTTSSLQQEAYHRHRLSSKATMALAQTLYEKGHITYMRTDSVGLSKDAQAAIVAYVEATYGSELARARQFKTRAANAQEAHEAIRPTRPEVTAEALDAALGCDHRRLYDLIRRRAIASQMTAAEYEEARLVFVAEAAPAYEFVAKQSSLIEPGYLLVYSPELAKEARAKSAGDVAKPVSARATSFQAVGNVTQPPAQYNEPGLVKALEKNGIGRPSTYASIIDKLFQKGYVVKGAAPVTTLEVPTWRVDAGGDVEEGEPVRVSVGSKEADRMQPTALGTEVTTCLADIAPMILDVDFTSRMEADLDCISKGEKKKVDVLTEFYGPFREAWGCATGLRPRAALPSAGDAK